MNKLIAALVAMTFSMGAAFAQTPATAPETMASASTSVAVAKPAKKSKHKKAKHKKAKKAKHAKKAAAASAPAASAASAPAAMTGK